METASAALGWRERSKLDERLGKQFGELTIHPFSPHLDDFPEVLLLDNHKDNPVFRTDAWHSDETFRIDPPMGSILRCIRIPERGGDTLWADMGAAYAGLSDKMQHLISGLEAVHDFQVFRRKFDDLPPRERHERLAKMEEELPNPTHPVVTTHPATGQKILFVNPQFTVAIKGMRDELTSSELAAAVNSGRIDAAVRRYRRARASDSLRKTIRV